MGRRGTNPTSMRNPVPLARTEALVIEELGEELLVYDLNNDRAHCLGATAARVWRACDGGTRVDAMGAALELDPDTVAQAVEELNGSGLLDSGRVVGTTRRELTLKGAKVGAAAAVMPLIVSITAPTPALAQTLAFCRSISTTRGCGPCQQAGCCCCEPADRSTKDCVPDAATCRALYGADAITSAGCN